MSTKRYLKLALKAEIILHKHAFLVKARDVAKKQRTSQWIHAVAIYASSIMLATNLPAVYTIAAEARHMGLIDPPAKRIGKNGKRASKVLKQIVKMVLYRLGND